MIPGRIPETATFKTRKLNDYMYEKKNRKNPAKRVKLGWLAPSQTQRRWHARVRPKFIHLRAVERCGKPPLPSLPQSLRGIVPAMCYCSVLVCLVLVVVAVHERRNNDQWSTNHTCALWLLARISMLDAERVNLIWCGVRSHTDGIHVYRLYMINSVI